MPYSTAQLKNIHTFDDLLRYLEEKLDWPLQEYQFDELTFEYQPEELGLKEDEAAKVRTIHQLRPLQHGQPWGIFFVEFENKKLPVVVLRRILSHLVVKKRASANKAGEAAWHAEDLLFITTFGEDDSVQREIAFAHFHQSAGDLPTLHVLGWDGGDTPLKLAHLDSVLQKHLRWPDNVADHRAWRQQWTTPFRHRIGHVIRTADALAEVLAALARGINKKATRMLVAESENGPLRKLYKAFQTALIHDLTEVSFADTYAQTITYGLLTAAISRTEWSEGRHGTFIIAENVSDMVPITNPFLKEMLSTFLKVGGRQGGIDFDELGIQDVVELLRGDETDLPEILRDFGNRTPGEDPVIHFYEHFLSAYNKKLKIQRGVFYTPKPVVSYIIRSVHELLQIEFGLEDGLASTITWGEMIKQHPAMKLPILKQKNPSIANSEDIYISPESPFVMILDIATGTGTFLVEIIDVIHKTMIAKWQKHRKREQEIVTLWNEYVPKHLLPRLYGYELMMAPYAIAHMKIGLKLSETGYKFMSDERVRVYLNNSLEPASDAQQKLVGILPALAHEAEAVNTVKLNVRFTVLVGNPPYAGHSWNLLPNLRVIVEPYRYVDGHQIKEKGALQFEKSIQDDYVKFFRFSEFHIAGSGVGLLGLVTSHGFLDNPFLRGMRCSLLSTFSKLFVLDLHGNTLRNDMSPDGSQDKNVFDIKRTGVAISLFSKRCAGTPTEVRHSEIWGDRENVKYPWLNSNSALTAFTMPLTPKSASYLLVPQDAPNLEEYEKGHSIGEIMPIHSKGVVTGRDAFVIDFDEETLLKRMRTFADPAIQDEELVQEFDLNPTDWWVVSKARKNMPPSTQHSSFIRPLLYRPFDTRLCFYHPAVFMSPRRPVMKHMEPGLHNLLLITSRMTKGESFHHVTVSRGLAEAILLSSKTSNNAIVFPLYLYPVDNERKLGLGLALGEARQPNFTPMFLQAISDTVGLPVTDGLGDFRKNVGVEDVFYYIIAILYSQTYRLRYADPLTRDFPRLPLGSNVELFRTLGQLGGELVALHLLEFPKVNDFITSFTGKGDNSIPKKPTWKDNAVWINPTQCFEGVPENVWNFHIGGYQVCEKWLKDRKGRTLSADDITHYQRIVVALNETIRLMTEIDQVIDEHGGWPIT